MARTHWRSIVLLAAASAALAACVPEDTTAPAPNAGAPAAPNSRPTISGTPAATVTAGTTYQFYPAATDADGDTLNFAATGLPAWATINPQTGVVSGTPGTSNIGTSSAIIITVSDGVVSTSLPAFTITVAAGQTTTPPATTNRAPTIGGSAPASVQANNAYNFVPTAGDADGDTLAFSITGKPGWLAFSTATGALSGTPTSAQVGSYTNIVITVSDGRAQQVLPAFSITVTALPGSGTATLSWSAPTQNTDGSPLTNLGGYRIYHGTSQGTLNDVRVVSSPTATSYQFAALTPGTHYFAISSINTNGIESAQSSVGSKAIP